MATYNGVPIPKPPSASIPNSLPTTFNWDSFSTQSARTYEQIAKNNSVAARNLKGYRTAAKSIKKTVFSSPSRKFVSQAAKQIKKNKGLIKKGVEAGKDLGKMLSRFPGKDTAGKAAGFAGKIAPIMIATAAFGLVVWSQMLQNLRFETQDRQNGILNRDLGTAYSLAGFAILKAKRLEAANKEAKLENQRVRDRLYGLEKQLVPIREKSNNALYEVRKGREILEGKITDSNRKNNDTLAETRSYNTKHSNAIAKLQADFNKYIGGVKDGFQQKIETTIDTLKKGLADAQANAKKANESISLQSKLITSLQDSIKAIKPIDSKATVDSIVAKIKDIFSPQLNKIPSIESGIVELKSANSNLRFDLSQFELAQSYIDAAQDNKSNSIAGGVTNLATAINQQNDKISQIKNGVVTAPPTELAQAIKVQQTTLDEQKKIVASLGGELKTFKESVVEHDRKLAQLNNGINGLNATNTQLKTDLGGLDTKLKEAEKVNTEGNQKLDKALEFLKLIPLIPQNVLNTIKPSIPTVPQITQATGTAICNSTKGGCLGSALNNQTSNINNNTNAGNNGLLDAFNTGSNAAQDAALAIINNKLGEQIPGGLSGKLVDGFKWLHLDRALNVLTFIATVQNHLMLSNDIGQTLLGALNNGLQLIGLKDDKGNAFDIGSVILSGVENLVKGIVGAENYAQISAAYQKAVRVYQATANILNAFQGLAQSILQANELIGAYTGRIGNALKRAGQVLENAYPWMNPEPKFNRVTQGLEALQAGASTIQQVTQAPLDVISQVTALTEASTEFTKAIKEDAKPENKSTVAVEPDTVKAAAVATKAASASPLFDLSDFFNADN